jgi:hypothetical protein
MNVATRAIVAATLLAAALSPAFAATHHMTVYRPYGYRAHAPTHITIYPARIDYSRYIDPVSGRFCHDDGWAATCVPPPLSAQGVNCRAGWPFPVCRYF